MWSPLASPTISAAVSSGDRTKQPISAKPGNDASLLASGDSGSEDQTSKWAHHLPSWEIYFLPTLDQFNARVLLALALGNFMKRNTLRRNEVAATGPNFEGYLLRLFTEPLTVRV